MVFFDFLGLFLIFYSQLTSTIINSVLFIVLTAIVAWCIYQIKHTQGMKFRSGILEFVIAVAIQLLGLIIGAAVTMFIAFILDICGRSMSWYSNQWLIFGLYFCPFFFCNACIPYLYIKWREQTDVADSYYVQLVSILKWNILNACPWWFLISNLGNSRPLYHPFRWSRCVNRSRYSIFVYLSHQYSLLFWHYITKCPFRFCQ